MITLVFYSLLIFLALVLLLCPAGWVLAERSGVAPRFRVPLSFGLGALWYVALLSLCLFVNLSRPGMLTVLYGSAAAMFGLWVTSGGAEELLAKSQRPPLMVMAAYYLFIVASAAFPNASLYDISGETTRLLSDLPIDNIISYNFSRYLVEGIPFTAVEAVPNWPATSRGPLAGALSAEVFIMLGAQERAGWLATSPGTFFLFHCVMTFLNVLSVMALWSLGKEAVSERSAAWALFLLCGTSFFYTNILFTWPKFFMAYYVLSALLLWRAAGERSAEWFLCGVMLGAAMLAHESAALYAIPLVSVLLVSKVGEFLRSRQQGQSNDIVSRYHALRCFTPPVGLAFGAFLVLLPWLRLKQLVGESSPRMLYLHLFCIKDQSVASVSLGEALSRYLRENTPGDILRLKSSNLFYPFDVSHAGAAVSDILLAPYRLVSALEPLSFFQLIYAVGPLLLFAAIVMLFSKTPSRSREQVRALVLLGFGALAAGALVFGCPESTVNHHWSYPLFLLLLLAAGWAASEGPWWLGLLVVLGWVANLLVLFIRAWFPDYGAVPIHASVDYLLLQAVCLVLLVLALAYSVLRDEADERVL